MSKKNTKKTAKKITTKNRRTVTSVARTMIIAGRTNEQVLAQLVKDFGLDTETKGHYAAWYRAQLVRQGQLTKTVAKKTAHAKNWKPRRRTDAVA